MASSIDEVQNITNDGNTVGSRQHEPKKKGKNTRFISSIVNVLAVGYNFRGNNTYRGTD